jgi:hypothetical protein
MLLLAKLFMKSPPGDIITVESPPIGTMTVPVRAHLLGQS